MNKGFDARSLAIKNIEESLIGMDINEAKGMLTAKNYLYRLSVVDGRHIILTMEFNPNRFNLEVTNGKVSAVFVG